jgi:ABC-type transporter Mla MlaB component
MINLDLKQNKDGSHLQISGEMTLEHAVELRQALVDLLAASGALQIGCEKVERADLAGLQLLCSTFLTAARQGQSLVVDIDELPVFQQLFADSGIPAVWREILSQNSQQKEA